MMGMVGGGNLDELCQVAAESGRARGAELSAWEAPPDQRALVRTASCRRCGRIAYVRSEPGLAGVAGEALTEPCSGRAAPRRLSQPRAAEWARRHSLVRTLSC
jgi:hypothetical protein